MAVTREVLGVAPAWFCRSGVSAAASRASRSLETLIPSSENPKRSLTRDWPARFRESRHWSMRTRPRSGIRAPEPSTQRGRRVSRNDLSVSVGLQVFPWLTRHCHIDFGHHEDHEGHEGFRYLNQNFVNSCPGKGTRGTVTATNLKPWRSIAVKFSFLRALRVLCGENFFTGNPE